MAPHLRDVAAAGLATVGIKLSLAFGGSIRSARAAVTSIMYSRLTRFSKSFCITPHQYLWGLPSSPRGCILKNGRASMAKVRKRSGETGHETLLLDFFIVKCLEDCHTVERWRGLLDFLDWRASQP